MDKYRVAIVIPAFNESATIREIVEATGKRGVPIVVDDGSEDQTADLALQVGANVVVHEHNRGYDAALESGFRKAAEIGCQVVITFDADGQHDPMFIEQFINQIDSGADAVVGVRSARQRAAEHAFGWYTGLRYGIRDPLCGLKAYRMELFHSLGHFDSYESIGTELIIYAARHGARIDQIPFQVRARKDKSRFGKALSGNLRIFRAMVLALWKVA